MRFACLHKNRPALLILDLSEGFILKETALAGVMHMILAYKALLLIFVTIEAAMELQLRRTVFIRRRWNDATTISFLKGK